MAALVLYLYVAGLPGASGLVVTSWKAARERKAYPSRLLAAAVLVGWPLTVPPLFVAGSVLLIRDELGRRS